MYVNYISRHVYDDVQLDICVILLQQCLKRTDAMRNVKNILYSIRAIPNTIQLTNIQQFNIYHIPICILSDLLLFVLCGQSTQMCSQMQKYIVCCTIKAQKITVVQFCSSMAEHTNMKAVLSIRKVLNDKKLKVMLSISFGLSIVTKRRRQTQQCYCLRNET